MHKPDSVQSCKNEIRYTRPAISNSDEDDCPDDTKDDGGECRPHMRSCTLESRRHAWGRCAWWSLGKAGSGSGDGLSRGFGAGLGGNVGAILWGNVGAGLRGNVGAGLRRNVGSSVWGNVGAGLRRNVGSSLRGK